MQFTNDIVLVICAADRYMETLHVKKLTIFLSVAAAISHWTYKSVKGQSQESGHTDTHTHTDNHNPHWVCAPWFFYRKWGP